MEARLVSLLRETFVELEDLWRSIGLTAKERAEQVESLYNNISELCKKRIETEKALAASYEEEVKRLREDIAICTERLDLVRKASNNTEKLPLVRELTGLRGDYEELDRKRTDMEKVMIDRLSLVHRCWDDMRMQYEVDFESVGFKLNAKRLNDIEHKYEEVKKEKERRQAIVKSRMSEACEMMITLELDEHPTTSFDHAIVTRNADAIGLSVDSIAALDNRILELQTDLTAKRAVLMRLATEIQGLWQRLEIPVHERNGFMQRHASCGDRSIQAFETKLAELKDLRRQRMSDFIEKVRAEMREAMEEARLPSGEKVHLNRMLSERVVADDYDSCALLLARHEQELDKLKKVVEAIRPIVRGAQKYLLLCQERIEYEALILDASRLLSRKPGAHSLQEEERMRKRTLEIPKFIASMKTMVEEFEQTVLSGTRLVLADILGEEAPVMDVIASTEREHQERIQREKEQRVQNKKQELEKPSSIPAKKVASNSAPSTTAKRVPMKPKN